MPKYGVFSGPYFPAFVLNTERYRVLIINIVFYHGTIIQKGITCEKIPCYMRDSACSDLLLKMLKYFEVMLNIFEFSHVKEIVKS